MIEVMYADAATLATEIRQSQVEVRLQSESVKSAQIYEALRSATAKGSRAYVLLGPRAEYEVVADRPMIGREPYPDAVGEFDSLKDVRAEVFINPRFSEIGAKGIQPGRASHASYLAVDKKIGVICTGKFQTDAFVKERNFCARTDEVKLSGALAALHLSEFDDTQDADARDKLERSASESVVVYPRDADKLLNMLKHSGRGTLIRTAVIRPESMYFGHITDLGTNATVILPKTHKESVPAVALLKAAGVSVKVSAHEFDGTVLLSGNLAFIGSVRLTRDSETKSRELGLVVNRASVRVLEQEIAQ